jgi:hypothetical protein
LLLPNQLQPCVCELLQPVLVDRQLQLSSSKRHVGQVLSLSTAKQLRSTLHKHAKTHISSTAAAAAAARVVQDRHCPQHVGHLPCTRLLQLWQRLLQQTRHQATLLLLLLLLLDGISLQAVRQATAGGLACRSVLLVQLHCACQLLLQLHVLLGQLAGDQTQTQQMLLSVSSWVEELLLQLLLLLLYCVWPLCKLCQVCDGCADVDDVEGRTILTHNRINLGNRQPV